PDIERALCDHLLRLHRAINATLFRGALRPVTLQIGDAQRELGSYNSSTRTLRIARRLLLDYDWTAIEEVLRHEMAHQYVSEVLGVRDESPHGPAFAQVCARFGIDATANGAPK